MAANFYGVSNFHWMSWHYREILDSLYFIMWKLLFCCFILVKDILKNMGCANIITVFTILIISIFLFFYIKIK